MSEIPSPETPTPSDYRLPKVSKDIDASVLAEAESSGRFAPIVKAEERLVANNPNLYEQVKRYMQPLIEINPDPEMAVRIAIIMTHELLRLQSETDELNRMLRPPDTT